MKRYRIYCEGITDQIFITDFIEYLYGIEFERFERTKKLSVVHKSKDFDIEVIDIGGCSKLKNDIWKNELRKNVLNNGTNIVIFDADYKHTRNGNKGIEACKKKLLEIKKEVPFEFYIWPNDENDGEIEDLLKRLVPKDNLSIFKCMDNFNKCLTSLLLNGIEIKENNNKQQINYYQYLTVGDSSLKNRNYKNSLIWELDINDEWINKFKEYLDFFFN